MILNLTDISSEPLQAQIVRQVRARILAGDLTAEESLPSIRVLARSHRVSAITVQKAYESLLRQDLIHARRGKGFFVSELSNETKKEMAKQQLRELLQDPLDSALAEGLTLKEIKGIVSQVLQNQTPG